jgi:hypothetical protein
LDLQVYRDRLDRQETLDQEVKMEDRVSRGHRVLLEFLEHLEVLDQLGQPVSQVNEETRDTPEHLERKGVPDHVEMLDQRDLRVSLVLRVRPGHLDPKDHLDCLGQRDSQEMLARLVSRVLRELQDLQELKVVRDQPVRQDSLVTPDTPDSLVRVARLVSRDPRESLDKQVLSVNKVP